MYGKYVCRTMIVHSIRDILKSDASMMVYSLLETARANGLSPQNYLEYLLKARPNENMSDEELGNMAHWNPKVQECCVNKS